LGTLLGPVPPASPLALNWLGIGAPKKMAKLVKAGKYYLNPEAITVVHSEINPTEGTEVCEIHLVNGGPLNLDMSAEQFAALVNSQ